MGALDDKTPNPEATPAEFARRFASLEKEFRELKKEFTQHKENDFDELEDRVTAHDLQFEDFKRLLLSIDNKLVQHQTTNGLVLQSIDRSMKALVQEMRDMREHTVLTKVPE